MRAIKCFKYILLKHSHKMFLIYFIKIFWGRENKVSVCEHLGRIQIMPIKKEDQINSYLIVTGRKDLAVDDGTCLFCPCFTIRVLAAGVHYKVYISTERILFPRIDEFQFIWCHIFASSFKIIFHIAIIVPTQTTYSFLDQMKAAMSIQQVTITFPFDYLQFPVL